LQREIVDRSRVDEVADGRHLLDGKLIGADRLRVRCVVLVVVARHVTAGGECRLFRGLRRIAHRERAVRLEVEGSGERLVVLVALADRIDVAVRVVRIAGQDILDRRRHDGDLVEIEGRADVVIEARIGDKLADGRDARDLFLEIGLVQERCLGGDPGIAGDVEFIHGLLVRGGLRRSRGHRAVGVELESRRHRQVIADRGNRLVVGGYLRPEFQLFRLRRAALLELRLGVGSGSLELR
jgi:hypothetical protein